MNLIHLYFTIHYLIHALIYHMISIECYCTRLKVKNPVIAFHFPLLFVIQLFVMVFCTSCILKFYSSSFILIQETIHPTYEITLSILSFAIPLPHHSSLSVSCMTFSKALYRISLVTCIQYNHSFFTIVIMSLSVIATFLIHFLAIV